MNITCLIDSLGAGGAQRQLVNLAAGFQRQGHRVRVITYHPNDFYSSALREHCVEHELLERTKPLRRLHNIRRALRTGAEEAVLAFLEGPSLWAELAAIPSRRWGLVVSERSGPETLSAWKSRMLRYGHYLADAVTVNSTRTREALARQMPGLRQRVHTVYNMVDLAHFSPWSEYLPRACGKAVVVVAASYRGLKNLHGLIEAVSLLRPQMRAQLQIEWWGDRHENVYETAVDMIRDRQLEDVFALNGPVSDIDTRMKKADAVGLFSVIEGLPNTICEGMACGKPVIMSRVSDAETLIEPGRNGWLCDPRDPSSIAVALEEFLCAKEQTCREMGHNSRLIAERLFSPERIVAEYLRLLTTARDKRAGR